MTTVSNTPSPTTHEVTFPQTTETTVEPTSEENEETTSEATEEWTLDTTPVSSGDISWLFAIGISVGLTAIIAMVGIGIFLCLNKSDHNLEGILNSFFFSIV